MTIEAVTALLRRAAAEAIMPRFRALAEGETFDKAPGEVVTVADRDAERIITAGLLALAPGTAVVGEEAVAADPSLLGALAGDADVWLVDPLDGTSNFVAGSTEFAVMAARVRGGVAVASWILQPVTGAVYVAELGSGAWCGGERLARPPDPTALRGTVLTRFLSEGARRHVEERAALFGEVTRESAAAGILYPRIAEGSSDFAAFHRTLPWDHAPGVLLLTEAGGYAARLDGTPYRPGQTSPGLLAASSPDAWQTVRTRLLP